ncbi:hypothetical protein SAMN03159444_03166 [Pseudomonas sp. NFACC02]|uniref:hypothetical protein n=1 Tax=Pseudomonas sp. NFACC02 TaxID=1566250 RepID=UPI0008C9D0D1|nr:hypothetical protein [Pseudomonas sp. NFACC02]SER07184.1 hypothetical protein SAMN03159444_03166 [Pseudomonas sp. NFACC02]
MKGFIACAPSGQRATPRFYASVNNRPFLASNVSGLSCLRPELTGARTHAIWKIHAVGQVARRRTVLGLFIDQTLQPGTYNLVTDERITAIYHLTPAQMARIYHSRDFQQGSVTLLECNQETGRLRGTFEFAMPWIDFSVSEGMFDLVCPHERVASASFR